MLREPLDTHPLDLADPVWSKGQLEAWALSSESTIALEYLAAIATGRTATFRQLRQAVCEGVFNHVDPLELARLARVAALQSGSHQHRDFALRALEWAVPRLQLTSATLAYRKLRAELLFVAGDYEAAKRAISIDADLAGMYHGYLLADAYNPFVTGDARFTDKWISQFNAPFIAHGLREIDVDTSSPQPFNSMRVHAADLHVHEEPLISVILTCFNPDEAELRLSAGSILAQTWRNLELIIVDDCSTSPVAGLLTEIVNADARVRVVRLAKNGGTYRARNVGIEVARGEFITGQDADDWSHPERLARQIDAYRAQPNPVGVITAANRTDDQLCRISPGLSPNRRCEVSLMYRRRDAQAIGGYLPVRKGADSEFRERLEAWSGKPVIAVDAPLYMIRLSADSLSRADFRPGWSHPARRAFWSAYKFWHGAVRRQALRLSGAGEASVLPFVVPSRMHGEIGSGRKYDVCYVCDWRVAGPLQRAAFDELLAATRAGLSVGILHLESPFSPARSSRSLLPELQRLINLGDVAQIVAGDNASVSLMVVRDPSVVDFGPPEVSGLTVENVLMVSPVDIRDGAKHRTFTRSHSEEMARRLFRTEPVWAVASGALQADVYGDRLRVLQHEYPLVVAEESFSKSRPPAVPSSLRKIGRAAENVLSDWPADINAIEAAYPVDGSTDVRILGDARAAARIMNLRSVPPYWLDFRDTHFPAKSFWRSLHFVVQFDRRDLEREYDRGLIEALAAGVVVIADSRYLERFGEAIVTAESSAVKALMTELEPTSEAYSVQAETGQKFVSKRFSEPSYQLFLKDYLASLDRL